jgi:putative PEP-CTERM system TPR-repeat lipoprotein
MRRFNRLVAVVAVTAFLAGCSDSQKEKKEHFDNAERFMAAGKTQEAIVEYRNALRADNKFGEARFKLAEAYVAVGNQNQAYRESIRAADLMPQNNEAQIRAARFLVIAGLFEDAKTRIQPVIDRDPSNAQAQLVLGSALVGLKDLDGAVREIEEAIKIEPGVVAYSNLAFVRLAQGDRAKAKAAFEKAIEVDPKSMNARLALAYFHWSNGDLVAAEETYKNAIAIEPKNALANRAMAAFYASTKRTQLAEPYLKTMAETGNPAAVLQAADFYLGLGRTADASALLTPLASDAKNGGQAQVRLAAIAYDANDKAKAHSLVDAVIAKEPRNIRALLMKAQWLTLEGKPKEALEQAQAAVKSEPRSAEAHFAMGALQTQLGMRKEAIGEFNEVLRLNPRASRAQVFLSRLNLMEGSNDSAVTFAESALSASPNDPQARVSLVRGLIARRDTVRAEQELIPLLKQYPKAADLYTLDAAVKVQKKDLAGARAAYSRGLELSPTSIPPVIGLANLDLAQNRPADARARIDRALATAPKNIELLITSAQAYGLQKDYAKAEANLRTAIQADSTSSRPYAMLASLLLAAGKIEEARAEFDQMAKRDPTNVGWPTMAAMIVHSQPNKKDEAKKRYEEILKGSPNAPVAANNLAWIYQEENQNLDEALRLAQSAASRLPDSAEVQDTIGMIYYRKELPALAVTAFERSLTMENGATNPSYQYHLAMALVKAGETVRARKAAQEALKLRPNYPEAQKLLAENN